MDRERGRRQHEVLDPVAPARRQSAQPHREHRDADDAELWWKDGTAWPSSVTTRSTESPARPRDIAANTPAGMPTGREMASVASASSAVAPARSNTSSPGWLPEADGFLELEPRQVAEPDEQLLPDRPGEPGRLAALLPHLVGRGRRQPHVRGTPRTGARGRTSRSRRQAAPGSRRAVAAAGRPPRRPGLTAPPATRRTAQAARRRAARAGRSRSRSDGQLPRAARVRQVRHLGRGEPRQEGGARGVEQRGAAGDLRRQPPQTWRNTRSRLPPRIPSTSDVLKPRPIIASATSGSWPKSSKPST